VITFSSYCTVTKIGFECWTETSGDTNTAYVAHLDRTGAWDTCPSARAVEADAAVGLLLPHSVGIRGNVSVAL